jgi:hypothetical protein
LCGGWLASPPHCQWCLPGFCSLMAPLFTLNNRAVHRIDIHQQQRSQPLFVLRPSIRSLAAKITTLNCVTRDAASNLLLCCDRSSTNAVTYILLLHRSRFQITNTIIIRIDVDLSSHLANPSKLCWPLSFGCCPKCRRRASNSSSQTTKKLSRVADPNDGVAPTDDQRNLYGRNFYLNLKFFVYSQCPLQGRARCLCSSPFSNDTKRVATTETEVLRWGVWRNGTTPLLYTVSTRYVDVDNHIGIERFLTRSTKLFILL